MTRVGGSFNFKYDAVVRPHSHSYRPVCVWSVGCGGVCVGVCVWGVCVECGCVCVGGVCVGVCVGVH